MTLEREMKATYNRWMAEKFLEHLSKSTNAYKSRQGSRDVLLNMDVVKPLSDFGAEPPTPTVAPTTPQSPSTKSFPPPKTSSAELEGDGGDGDSKGKPKLVATAKQSSNPPLGVLHEDSQWDGGDGYFSDGSDYGDYVEQHHHHAGAKLLCPKKRRLHRIGSAMDAVEPRLSETLLSSPPTSSMQLSLDTNTAPPDFSFATINQQDCLWDGGDAFFSEGSEMSPTHGSDDGAPVEGHFENLSLCDNKQPHSNSSGVAGGSSNIVVDDTPMEEEWEGGDGYFSGSDYGDYVDA